ncbi:hypothetical protein [Sphingobium sp. AP50]|uniref:hypothetical protein n=1 Tax=Sphingobium sp. AP50 TaxID=1884369 RepID=UPI0011602225|nr:hypothetical protein [Sphingobium sp. AP50]
MTQTLMTTLVTCLGLLSGCDRSRRRSRCFIRPKIKAAAQTLTISDTALSRLLRRIPRSRIITETVTVHAPPYHNLAIQLAAMSAQKGKSQNGLNLA